MLELKQKELLEEIDILPIELKAKIIDKILSSMTPIDSSIDALWLKEANRKKKRLKLTPLLLSMVMKCVICKHGETKAGLTTVTLEKDNSTIVFKEVPAYICDNCGEKYIDASITRVLLSKAKEISKNGVEVDIRRYQKVA